MLWRAAYLQKGYAARFFSGFCATPLLGEIGFPPLLRHSKRLH